MDRRHRRLRIFQMMQNTLRHEQEWEGKTCWFAHEMRYTSKGPGKWGYLCRAIDYDGNLVASMLSEKGKMKAAQRFFQQAGARIGHMPASVTTDGHHSYPRAIR